MESNPLVSVIIPFYNREDLTLVSVKSVLNQSFQDFEIILVDDGSNEPINKIEKLNNSKIQLFHQTNKGPAAARNLGLLHAKGKYIAFLDSDDFFLSEKLKLQVEIHENNPNIWLTHTSYNKIDNTGKVVGIVNSGKFTGKVFPDILNYCPIATPTVMINRAVLDESILYEEKYTIAEDLLFYAKITKQSGIIGIDIPLSSILITKNSHFSNINAQVIGFNNILDFLKTGYFGLTQKESREIISKISFSLALINFTEGKNKNLFNFLVSSIKAIYFSNHKIKTAINVLKTIVFAILTKHRINL